MKKTNKSKQSIKEILEFIQNYRISTLSDERFLGVRDTVIGWALIAFSLVFFETANNVVAAEVGFVFLFLSGFLSIGIYVLFESLFSNKKAIKGLQNLLIKKHDAISSSETHLTSSQRIKWIYFRGFIATGGYIALNIAKISFGVVDNSQLFGADVIVYALFASLLLMKRYNFSEWIGILLASSGIFFICFFNLRSVEWKSGIFLSFAGLFSALSMTIIFFITGIIVRHDPPQRIAFHQCIVGFGIAVIFLLATLIFNIFFSDSLYFQYISFHLIKNSIIAGVIYALALIFFLRAFLYIEPIIIAAFGSSLGVFVILFEWFFKGTLVTERGAITATLILVGCLILVHQEFKKEKHKKKKLDVSKPIYQKSLGDELRSLEERFHSGVLDKYSYISEKHEFNKLLLEYSSLINDSPIKCIEILPHSLIFTFKNLDIQLETDAEARSAPFEVLNFGKYETEDDPSIYNLIHDRSNIIDIGAHIGWYTINIAKRFPHSKIYAFEPIDLNFEILKKNVMRNNITNAFLYNYGLFNKNEERYLYYFKGGSPSASIENLLEHTAAKKVRCTMKTLDQIVSELKITSVDFIKCDAPGAELFVIQGAEKTIEKFKPIIFINLCEKWFHKCGYTSSDVIKALQINGYEIFKSSKNKLKRVKSYKNNNENGIINYFFLNTEKHSKIINIYK